MKHMSGRKILSVLFLAVFLIISCLYIDPKRNSVRSDNMSFQPVKVTTKDEKSERTDFVDQNGKVTVAANLGYATMIVTKKENGLLEQYYDEQGKPAKRINGYFAVFREYDEQGNNIRDTYLDSEGNPMITSSGYAKEERIYNDSKQVVFATHYDTENNPVVSPFFGYGRINEYDENGNNIRITYIDTTGKAMMTAWGFASVFHSFYGNDSADRGRVENEYYFDDKGDPVALSLGQYGIHIEYNENGQESYITYLDADGEPITTNKGYTTIYRTYHADNSIATEQYYDSNGNPFPLPDGQYGILKEGDRTVYLDKNGKETFNIRRFLYNHPRIVIPAVLAAVLLSAVTGKKQNAVLLMFCIAVIVYMTLLFRGNEAASFSGFLRYYRRFFTNSTARSDILKNIWLFIPLGSVLYRLYPKTTVLFVPLVFSILIEGIQLISGSGTCELDDIISNSMGGWIGFGMGRLAEDIRLFIRIRKQIHFA